MALEPFVTIRTKVETSTTKEELSDAISYGMQHSTGLSPEQQGVLRSVIDTQKLKLWLPRENIEKVETLAETYKDIDDKNFSPLQIETTNTNDVTLWDVLAASTVPWVAALTDTNTPPWTMIPATPEVMAHIEANTPKRTRKAKEEPVPTTPALQNMYRVKRRVNRPIDWVQYSNNEYEVEVSSTDQATLLSELDAIEQEVIQRLSLYNKDALESHGQKQKEIGYKQWVKEAEEKAKATKPVAQAPQKINTFVYDMSHVSTLDPQYTLARYQRLNSFVLQAFEKFPEVKALYTEFDKVNPKIQPPSL